MYAGGALPFLKMTTPQSYKDNQAKWGEREDKTDQR